MVVKKAAIKTSTPLSIEKCAETIWFLHIFISYGSNSFSGVICCCESSYRNSAS